MPSGKPYRWELEKHGEQISIDVPGALTLDHSGLMAEASADGLGIAFVPESFARALLDAGRLTTVLDDWCPPIPGLTLFYPSNAHTPAALRAFVDVLEQTNRAARSAAPPKVGDASPRPARAARAAAGPLQARARASRRGGNDTT